MKTKEDIYKQISELEGRQQELMLTMTQSDAHASKCVKLGVQFAEVYPDEFAAYGMANKEYNDNEVKLAELYEIKKQEEEAELDYERIE